MNASLKKARNRTVFSQLLLPRPLTPATVEAVMLRLASDRAAPPLLLEIRADDAGIRHIIGTPPEHVRWVQRTLRDLLVGIEIEPIDESSRPKITKAVRLRIRPRGLSLAVDHAELTSRSLLSALHAAIRQHEVLVQQIVLGPRVGPQALRDRIPDPAQPWWSLLLDGHVEAPASVRRQAEDRQAHHGFACVIRLGAAATTPERERQLIIGLLGALSTAVSPGLYIDLMPDRAAALNDARPPYRWPLHLSTPELVGILGWPLGDGDFPGLPPLHPRLPRVAANIVSNERPFATSIRSNTVRTVGLRAADSLSHLIALGPTGSGKSNALLHLIRADIVAGRAVLVIDPKRQLIDDIINRAVPKERLNDTVILDPSSDRPPGFNPLDVGDRDPDVIVDGLLAVLAAVFHDGWGPRTQDIIHSGLLTLARGGRYRSEPFTLLDLPRILTDQRFRTRIIGAPTITDDPGLSQFWSSYQAMTPAAQAQAIAAPLNKLRQYLLRPALRRILGQPSPRFRLRDLFRDNRIVLVPLNEGLIGPLTAQLLGSLIVAETWQATLERATENAPTDRPGMVYIDEVQQYLHLPTSIGDALAQSRSLGVGWHLAHQYRAQLPSLTRAAVDSNARSKIVFRLTDPNDAHDLAKQAPELEAVDFQSLGVHQAYINLSVGGGASGWCAVQTLPPPQPTGLGAQIRHASRARFGQPLAPSPPRSPDPAPAAHGRIGRKPRGTG